MNIKAEKSSGNVFADLGFDSPEEMLAKAELVRYITHIIEGRQLTQIAAAEILGIDQPKVSALMRGRLDGFSMDRIIHFLTRLNRDVTITVKKKPGTRELAQVKAVAA